MRFDELKYRVKLFPLFFLILLLILETRIVYLQFFHDDFLKARAHGNKLRKIYIEPARGNIYDRNGKLIVDNRHAYNLYIVPERLLSSPNSIAELSNLLELSPDSLVNEIISSGYKVNQEIRFRRNIGIELYSKVSEQVQSLYGVYLKNEWRRNFKYKTAPHLIGYLAEVKYKEQETEYAKIGDLKGKEGIEYIYDYLLRGKKGVKTELRNVKNKKISDWKPEEWIKAEEGADIFLTIDLELQQYIEKEFLNYSESGAVVVMNCKNGEVLAMVSMPDFPLDIFSNSLTYDEWNYWSQHPNKPLYNKAIMGEYPPGSVLKMGSLLSCLDQKITTEDYEKYCPGGMQIGRMFKKCWLHTGHGKVNAVNSIVWSCDTYFYEMSKHINIDKWNETLSDFGLGKETNIDLRYEKDGFIPDLLYYRKRVRGNLTGRFANLLIGQGEVLTTPLQIAVYTAGLANEDFLPKPHVMSYYNINNTFHNYSEDNQLKVKLPRVYKKHFKTLKEGMYKVVNSSTGTGRRSRSSKITFSGKTGTAENPHGKDHGWFTSFGPSDNPEIVVTIFGEHALHGSSMGPLAKKIYEKWLEIKQTVVSENEN